MAEENPYDIHNAPGHRTRGEKMKEFVTLASLALMLGYGAALAAEPGDAARGLSY